MSRRQELVYKKTQKADQRISQTKLTQRSVRRLDKESRVPFPVGPFGKQSFLNFVQVDVLGNVQALILLLTVHDIS